MIAYIFQNTKCVTKGISKPRIYLDLTYKKIAEAVDTQQLQRL